MFKDYPKWANWLVVNYNYRIGYHEKKPILERGVWVSGGKWEEGKKFDYTKTLNHIGGSKMKYLVTAYNTNGNVLNYTYEGDEENETALERANRHMSKSLLSGKIKKYEIEVI